MPSIVAPPAATVRMPDSGHTTMPPLHTAAQRTELGWMAIAWSDEALRGLVFGHSTPQRAAAALRRALRLAPSQQRVADSPTIGQSSWVAELLERLRQFAEGQPVDFIKVPVALDHLSPFARRVVRACRQITWGRVCTYGQLAAICGSPSAARAVGSVMAKNRYPLVVPCHRVVGAAGLLGGYSAPGGLSMKQRLLATERVEADNKRSAVDV